jgi:hypothetical protein
MRLILTLSLTLLLGVSLYSQNKPYRVGTTAASFLAMGMDGAGSGMGEAYVSVTRDLSSIYWNPSGLSYLKSNEAQFVYKPWIADITASFAGVAVNVSEIGTFAIGITSMDFGDIDVTTMEMQEGTGETYSAFDYAMSLSYARKLAPWFSFGMTGKYIQSKISRLSASAIAADMGVMVNTSFFSPDGNQDNGIAIGMSISNYGTRMQYQGLELLRPIDIKPDENGNYKDVEGQFKLQSWDLPIIYRLGLSYIPFKTESQMVTLAVDALHPNNNSESVNTGAQYQISSPGFGTIFLRGGWHGLFMDNSPYGLTLGVGFHFNLLKNTGIKIDYAYQDTKYFEKYSSYSIGIVF